MGEALAGFAIGPMLPAGGVTFDVTCRTAPGARGRPHPVTVTADWSLATPHDLDTERIAVALGGTLTCVDLADRLLPAARDLLEHVARAVPTPLERDGARWHVGVPADGCACATRTFPSATDAARHLRDPRHWARFHGVRPAALDSLVSTLRGGRPLSDARCPLPHGAADAYLTEPGGLDELWDAGVHPARVPALVASLSPHGDPLPTHLVLARAALPDDQPWLEPFAARGPLVLAWAARTRTRRDARHPAERLEWVEAGVPLPAIADVFTGSAYSLADAHAYAQAAGVGLDRAARTLGRWQASGTTPSVVELVELAASDPLLADPPGPDAVARVLALAPGHPRTAAALALARWGTAPDAAAHLRRTPKETP